MENIVKAEAFYYQGLKFQECATRCMGERNEDGSIQIIGGKYQPISTPLMVNTAFACEIFLKALLITNNIDYNTILHGSERHKLKKLYDLLPKEYKEFLCVGDENKFEQELKAHSDDFIKWRYYMENSGEYCMKPLFAFTLMSNLEILVKTVLDKVSQNVSVEQESV